MREFIVQYYDETDEVWREVDNWEDLSYTFPNGGLQLAPTASFTVDKDINLNTHQQIRVLYTES